MSEQEPFLARWSRRKQAAAAEPVGSPAAVAAEASEQQREGKGAPEATGGPSADNVASAAKGPDAVEPLFDPDSLPPIESIAADTDIRAFLAPGVPPELSRAALRRAWAADPKIRDFVGLADYDWDFNAIGSMAGFGPLEMTEELRAIALRIIGPPPVAETATDPAEGIDFSKQGNPHGENTVLVHNIPAQEPHDPSTARDPYVAAAQKSPDATEKSRLVVRQRHGGALPK